MAAADLSGAHANVAKSEPSGWFCSTDGQAHWYDDHAGNPPAHETELPAGDLWRVVTGGEKATPICEKCRDYLRNGMEKDDREQEVRPIGWSAEKVSEVNARAEARLRETWGSVARAKLGKARGGLERAIEFAAQFIEEEQPGLVSEEARELVRSLRALFTETADPQPEGPARAETDFERVGRELGELVASKNAAYGDSFARSGECLRLIFPDGVHPRAYRDLLGVARVLDKLFRIGARAGRGTAEDPHGESPWRDVGGYGIVATVAEERERDSAIERELAVAGNPARERVRAAAFHSAARKLREHGAGPVAGVDAFTMEQAALLVEGMATDE